MVDYFKQKKEVFDFIDSQIARTKENGVLLSTLIFQVERNTGASEKMIHKYLDKLVKMDLIVISKSNVVKFKSFEVSDDAPL